MANWLAALGQATPAITQNIKEMEERPFTAQKKALNEMTLNKMRHEEKLREEEEKRKAKLWIAENDIMFLGWPEEHKTKAIEMLKKDGVLNERGEGTHGGRDQVVKMVVGTTQIFQWVSNVETITLRKVKEEARENYTKLSSTPGTDPKKLEKAKQAYIMAADNFEDHTDKKDKAVEAMKKRDKYLKVIKDMERQGMLQGLTQNQELALKRGLMIAAETGNENPLNETVKDIVKPAEERVAQNYMLPNGQTVMSRDGGKTYIGKDDLSHPMPPDALKITPMATLQDLQAQKGKEEAKKEIGISTEKPTRTDMEEIALKGTGPWAMLAAAIDNVAGGIGLDKIFGKEGIFKDTQQSRQTLRILKQTGKVALMNSSRGAIWEQQRIDELFPDPDKLWRNPSTEALKFEELRKALWLEKHYNNQAIIKAVNPEEVFKLRQSNNELDRLLTLIGQPGRGMKGLNKEEEALIEKYLPQEK